MPRKKRDPRGGPRENAGRPKLPSGTQRVQISVSVAPNTLARIDAIAREQDVSRGAVIDGVVDALNGSIA